MHGLSILIKNKVYGKPPKRDDKNAAKERRTPNEYHSQDTIVGLCCWILAFLLLVPGH